MTPERAVDRIEEEARSVTRKAEAVDREYGPSVSIGVRRNHLQSSGSCIYTLTCNFRYASGVPHELEATSSFSVMDGDCKADTVNEAVSRARVAMSTLMLSHHKRVNRFHEKEVSRRIQEAREATIRQLYRFRYQGHQLFQNAALEAFCERVELPYPGNEEGGK